MFIIFFFLNILGLPRSCKLILGVKILLELALRHYNMLLKHLILHLIERMTKVPAEKQQKPIIGSRINNSAYIEWCTALTQPKKIRLEVL
jgi:hypothetical protein